jgi:CubicO group peptidase (beta-lactamase class C family)
MNQFLSSVNFLRHCRIFVFHFALGMGMFSVCALAEEAPNPLTKHERVALFRETVDKILSQIDSKQGPGLAFWLEVDGEVVYSKGAGLAQKENLVPIDTDTTFELASASKPLTAVVAMHLVESGMLGLDDVATTWMPELPAHWSTITVRSLMTQTAGIPDYMSQINAAKLMGLDGLTNTQLLKKWDTLSALNFPPGTKVEYSNSNYVVLAEIVSKACGMSFGQCLRQRVFDPLGMTRTRVESDAPAKDEKLALNYALTRKTKGIRLLTEGPTGIYSSLNDMSVWLRAYQAGKIISKSGADLMAVPASANSLFDNGDRYGMGWVIPADFSEEGAYAHAGQKDGYRTLISGNPSRRINYIILSNGGDFLQMASTEIEYWVSEIFRKQ